MSGILLSLALLLQAGVRSDFIELRGYLAGSYRSTIQALDAKNQILLRNTEPLAPAQAAEMRKRMQAPDRLPADPPVLSASIDNVGQGLVTFLFDDDFIVEQVNFVFCPAQGTGELARPERLMTIHILFDESRALRPAPILLQTVYQLPPPLAPPARYEPVLAYPLRFSLLATVWDLGTIEVLHQPVPGQNLVTAQMWLTDKTVAADCSAVPKMPGAG